MFSTHPIGDHPYWWRVGLSRRRGVIWIELSNPSPATASTRPSPSTVGGPPSQRVPLRPIPKIRVPAIKLGFSSRGRTLARSAR
ncbi:unnamed protein product [Acanthoscelides obtectus]|uniref:Uncharacterized protein n=1 Tax=Acanthoscelides obtectus TaxID=200917 RepID=A0A9P0QBI0_ACAOB|nr:unnamed protein product [Acanthoscelides obtectus]CAK1688989.1 hypothetical protein AOBTE_LOCUS36981 [Acanthoscelides obtectus]